MWRVRPPQRFLNPFPHSHQSQIHESKTINPKQPSTKEKPTCVSGGGRRCWNLGKVSVCRWSAWERCPEKEGIGAEVGWRIDQGRWNVGTWDGHCLQNEHLARWNGGRAGFRQGGRIRTGTQQKDRSHHPPFLNLQKITQTLWKQQRRRKLLRLASGRHQTKQGISGREIVLWSKTDGTVRQRRRHHCRSELETKTTRQEERTIYVVSG